MNLRFFLLLAVTLVCAKGVDSRGLERNLVTTADVNAIAEDLADAQSKVTADQQAVVALELLIQQKKSNGEDYADLKTALGDAQDDLKASEDAAKVLEDALAQAEAERVYTSEEEAALIAKVAEANALVTTELKRVISLEEQISAAKDAKRDYSDLKVALGVAQDDLKAAEDAAKFLEDTLLVEQKKMEQAELERVISQEEEALMIQELEAAKAKVTEDEEAIAQLELLIQQKKANKEDYSGLKAALGVAQDELSASEDAVKVLEDALAFEQKKIEEAGGYGASQPASGGGDPHFNTWDGTHYSYQGGCDLVMASSEEFGHNKGLDLHIRTTVIDTYSSISNAVLRIGEDIFEVSGDASLYFNGNYSSEMPAGLHVDGYRISKRVSTKCRGSSGDKGEQSEETCHDKVVYKVDLGNQEYISISAFKGFLQVVADATLPGTRGMLGTQEKPGLLGRDGIKILATEEMGAEWQVNDKEPKLFNALVAPQYPEACILPDNGALKAGRRRLGENAALRRLAAEACAKVSLASREACIFDVQETGDADMAFEYIR